MKTFLALLLALALLPLALAGSPSLAQEEKKEEKEAKEKKAKKEKKEKKDKKKGESDEPRPESRDAQRELARIMRDLQFALEGSSARSFLGYFDSAKFDDYPRFEDMVERLMREDTIRAYFRTAFSAPPAPGQNKAQMVVDAEMELGRKDAVGQLQRRKQQLAIDFEYTRRGWKIINLTPRNFFQPL